MSEKTQDLKEFHWLMDLLQTIDVGLVVLDREYKIQVWNSFMENHSGLFPNEVQDQIVFDVFPEIPIEWLKNKSESVFLLKNRTFTTWEQRPYIFRFKNYRPITGMAEHMYQNSSFIPLESAAGHVDHICLIIYDVTDTAVGKLELESANQELAHLSRTDRLTQLNNRGHWEELLIQEYKRCRRTNVISSLIMFDIDHFKLVNDNYGHQAGDQVIRITADTLKECIRETDIAGRYGGEEFGIVLVNTDAEQAKLLADRLRTKIESLIIESGEHTIKYKISLGISEFDDSILTHSDWIEQSDQALYFSKENGRNKATIYADKMK